MRKMIQAFLVFALSLSLVSVSASETPVNQQTKVDNTWYYNSLNNGEFTFEKVSHPDRGAFEVDGLIDDADARSQSYTWSAVEYGDYIYIGTCYNSTYGIYWRNVFQMMMKAGKSQAEAMKIARDFVQFIFDERFDERLQVRGIVVKYNKLTGEFSTVFDAKTSSDPAIKATSCSGYRMAFEKDGKVYFVSLANPTMFLLEIDPTNNDHCEIAFKRSLSAEGSKKQIAAGVHGLIVYQDEIIMCLAGEAVDDGNSTYLDGKAHPEGGYIVASKDARNWRVIADEADLGPSAYHNYDGLMGGGIWDVIEYNGDLYVTVVTDLTDITTGKVNKQGFAMYKGVKDSNGEYTWQMKIGDTSVEGVNYPYGLGCNVSMACNLWVYDGYLYLGTYNDPMLDLAEVPASGDFALLYNDLYYSIFLYRMDANGNIELVNGKTSDLFPTRIGNLGDGLGDHSNQYVWRYVTHNDELWLATYDTATLTRAFTQLTDGQLANMSEEDYLRRLNQLETLGKSLGVLEEKYADEFEMIFGSKVMQKLFGSIQGLIDAKTGHFDPVIPYKELVKQYEDIKAKIIEAQNNPYLGPKVKYVLSIINGAVFKQLDSLISSMHGPVYYFGVNYYMKNCTDGFDLMYTKDGVNFEVVTKNGFGDPSNHGVRTLISADNGNTLYVGTANPYYGSQYWKLDTPQVPEVEYVTVTFAADEHATIDGEASYVIEKGNMLETIPTITVEEGYEFNGWLLDGEVYTDEQILALSFDKDTTFTAIVSEVDVEPEIPEVQKATVTFNPGSHGKLEGTTSYEVVIGEKITTVPVVVADAKYEFIGWSNGETTLTSSEVCDQVVTGDVTYTAVYKEKATVVLPEITTHKVTFEPGSHGTINGETVYDVKHNETLVTVPVAVGNDGYTFNGWMLNGKLYSQDEVKEMAIVEDVTFVASYEEIPVMPEIPTVGISSNTAYALLALTMLGSLALLKKKED